MLENLGAQAVFSSIFPETVGDFKRNKWAQDINIWLQNWWLHQNFGFFKPWKSLWGTSYAVFKHNPLVQVP